jgi:hypothetical protein
MARPRGGVGLAGRGRGRVRSNSQAFSAIELPETTEVGFKPHSSWWQHTAYNSSRFRVGCCIRSGRDPSPTLKRGICSTGSRTYLVTIPLIARRQGLQGSSSRNVYRVGANTVPVLIGPFPNDGPPLRFDEPQDQRHGRMLITGTNQSEITPHRLLRPLDCRFVIGAVPPQALRLKPNGRSVRYLLRLSVAQDVFGHWGLPSYRRDPRPFINTSYSDYVPKLCQILYVM